MAQERLLAREEHKRMEGWLKKSEGRLVEREVVVN